MGNVRGRYGQSAPVSCMKGRRNRRVVQTLGPARLARKCTYSSQPCSDENAEQLCTLAGAYEQLWSLFIWFFCLGFEKPDRSIFGSRMERDR